MSRQRGSIRKRGDTWKVTLYTGTDGGGQRQYRYKTVKGPKREAQQELTRMLKALDEGTLRSLAARPLPSS